MDGWIDSPFCLGGCESSSCVHQTTETEKRGSMLTHWPAVKHSSLVPGYGSLTVDVKSSSTFFLVPKHILHTMRSEAVKMSDNRGGRPDFKHTDSHVNRLVSQIHSFLNAEKNWGHIPSLDCCMVIK